MVAVAAWGGLPGCTGPAADARYRVPLRVQPARDRRGAGGARGGAGAERTALTTMCVVSFSTTFVNDVGTHFRWETYVLFWTLGVLGAVSLWDRRYTEWVKARWDTMRLSAE